MSRRDDTYKCNTCNNIFPFSGFHSDRSRHDGRKHTCKSCHNEMTRKRRAEKRILNPPQKINLEDLSGKEFKLLTILRQHGVDERGWRTWVALCNCGKEIIVNTSEFNRGAKPSCGCTHYKNGSEVYNWSGYEDISGSLLYEIRNGAKLRDLEYNIEPKYIWDLFVAQNRRCAMTGLPIDFKKPRTASLDRISSSLGYFPGNVQWVHKNINRMKSIFSVEYFKEVCRLVCNMEDSEKRRKSFAGEN